MQEDLVYFVHSDCAGVSAFVRGEADASHRNADFAAVGALVPLSYGRVGRGWVLAPELRRLAKGVLQKDGERDTAALEAFWEKNKHDDTARDAAPEPRPTTRDELPASLDRKRKRARSDVTGGLSSDQEVGSDHPALCMPELLDTFGPLTFPLFRAALLRNRILVLGQPPVQQTCNFIYVLSVLANIPPSLRELLQPDMETAMRMQPLFSVGISDIPRLSEHKDGQGWIACTTDDILRDKHPLYDLLVTMPGTNLNPTKHRWPTITTSSGALVKATQRDLRRYRLLRAELNRIRLERERYRDQPSEDRASHTSQAEDDGEGVPLVPTTTILNEVRAGPNSADDTQVVEPTSWTAMAYNGFLWWASAGELEAWESEEVHADRALLDDLPELEVLMEASSPTASRTSFSSHDEDERHKQHHKARATAVVVTAYFHRLTAQILGAMADVVEAADDATEDGVADQGIDVSTEDVKAMGLDGWSDRDLEFVRDAMRLWFGREGVVEREGMRVCGVRIC